MKSILFYIARYPGYGGIENITTLLANHLSLKNQVSILSCTQQDEKLLLKQLDARVRFYKIPNEANIEAKENQIFFNDIITNNKIDTIIYQDSYYPNEKLLLNIINRDFINIICAEHSTPDNGIKTFIYALKKTPWFNLYIKLKICYFHGIGLIKSKKRKRILYNFCNKYIVLSQGYIPIFLKLNNIKNSHKIKAIENPISIPILENVPPKENICLFVGRFSPEKGILNLLKIWKEIEKDITLNEWKLVMVGDGQEKNTIKNYIKENNLKRIQLEGFKTDITPYYKKASILCMTSIFEGFPLTLPEAMGNGVVPIAFNSFAAISDIINHKINGIIIPPNNTSLYIQNLKEVIRNNDERKKLAEAALHKAKDFSQERIFNKWNAIINNSEKP